MFSNYIQISIFQDHYMKHLFSGTIIKVPSVVQYFVKLDTKAYILTSLYKSTVTVQSLPKWHSKMSCHFQRPSLMYSSTDLKSTVTGDHNSNHFLPVLPPSGLQFKDHLPSVTLLTQRNLSPRRPEQWQCRVSFPVLERNGHFKTIFQVGLYQFKEFCPKRP